MNFEQLVTILALLVGPGGVVLGWWLSQASETRQHDRELRTADRGAQVERVTTIVRESRRAAGELRSLAHGASMGSRVTQGDQFRATADTFNKDWRALEVAIIEAELLGPDWVSESAALVMQAGQAVLKTVTRMQQSLTNDGVTVVQEEIEKMDTAVTSLVQVARSRLHKT